MKLSHMKLLHETGSALLIKAQTLSKISDIERCINLGSKLLAEAREIMEDQQLDSILIFAEFIHAINAESTYEIYAEFCVRNNLQVYSEEDYTKYIFTAQKVIS